MEQLRKAELAMRWPCDNYFNVRRCIYGAFFAFANFYHGDPHNAFQGPDPPLAYRARGRVSGVSGELQETRKNYDRTYEIRFV